MVRLYGKRVALLSVAAMLLVGGGWIWLREASAAACSGTKEHDVILNGGPVIHAETLGGILISRGGTTINSTGHAVTALHVEDVFSAGKVEGLGELSINLDTSRQQPPSSLTGLNADGTPLPARQVVQFYPVFELNGEVFRAQDAARVENSNIKSFPPPPGTVYVLTNAMKLTSARGNTMELAPGRAFTIDG